MSINLVRKGSGSWAFVSALLLSCFFMVGCKSSHPTNQPPSSVQATNAASTAIVDLIHVGDSLQITFTDLPAPVPPFEDKVKEEGTITLMLNQTFVVTNKTRGDLEREIRLRYVPEYYRYMTVSVIHQGQTRFYYVGGEVKSPGRQVYVGPITVTKAIQTAGDFTDFGAKNRVKLTRVDGRIFTINCKKALLDPRLDLEVYPGDKITVPRKFW